MSWTSADPRPDPSIIRTTSTHSSMDTGLRLRRLIRVDQRVWLLHAVARFRQSDLRSQRTFPLAQPTDAPALITRMSMRGPAAHFPTASFARLGLTVTLPHARVGQLQHVFARYDS